MTLINCEINLILTWSENCIIVSTNGANQGTTFTTTETKLYVLVVTSSTQDNTKLLQLLKSGFKRITNWNKYLSKPELLARNPILNHLVERSFQRINRLFVLAFENDKQRTSNKGYYLPNVDIKVYNVMIDGKKCFDQPIENNENLRKIATVSTTACSLDYHYFKDDYKMIAADLCKQQALDADSRAIEQVNFTRNLDRADNTRTFFILGEAQETILDFSQGTGKVL